MSITPIRKLSAVMFTDIMGYTAMVQANEQKALGMVDIYRKVLEAEVASHGGKVIEYYGDGGLCIFESVLQAVECSVAMQLEYQKENVPVRVGVHLGDIVFRDDTVYGDGVNVASRIESQGTPGSVLISQKVENELKNHPQIATKSIGFYNLKNVSHPVEIFAIDRTGLVVPKKKKLSIAARVKSSKFIIPIFISLVILGVFGYQNGFFDNIAARDKEFENPKIAITYFENMTTLDSLNEVGNIVAYYITSGLQSSDNANVVNYLLPDETSNIAMAGLSSNQNEFQSLGVNQIVKGAFFKVNDSLEFEASLVSVPEGILIEKFKPVRCVIDDPSVAMVKLRSQIRGYWESKGDEVIRPPNYEAYKDYIEARKFMAQWESEKAKKALKNAIEKDPMFIDSYLLLITTLYNLEDYSEALDYVNLMKANFPDMTIREKDQLAYHESDILGNNIQTYQYFLREHELLPQDLYINTTTMVLAKEYINEPELVIEAFKQIPIEEYDYEQCAYCTQRLHLALASYIELGDQTEARNIVSFMPKNLQERRFYSILIRYYAQTNDTLEINRLLETAKRKLGNGDYWHLNYSALREFSLIGNTELQNKYGQVVIDSLQGTNSRILARSYHLLGKNDEALESFSNYLSSNPDHLHSLSKMGFLYAKTGMIDEANEMINKLERLKQDFDYGVTPYYQGKIYHALGDDRQALNKFEQAVNEGFKFYIFNRFETDPDLLDLKNNPRYQQIIHPYQKNI